MTQLAKSFQKMEIVLKYDKILESVWRRQVFQMSGSKILKYKIKYCGLGTSPKKNYY
jgi:hypothetical protein